eukprot:scaffold259835_cov36-Tisochrysis_lutea.AAC.3
MTKENDIRRVRCGRAAKNYLHCATPRPAAATADSGPPLAMALRIASSKYVICRNGSVACEVVASSIPDVGRVARASQ